MDLMSRILPLIVLAVSACAGPLAAAGPPAQSDSPGEALAQRLRSAEPDENSEIHGTLIIRAGKRADARAGGLPRGPERGDMGN